MRVFDFGANWQAFSADHIDQDRLTTARQSLQSLLQRPSLRGARVLDVGCGSGLFAIAAHQMGARDVVAVDINPRCVRVSEHNRQRLAPHAPVLFRQCSALDPALRTVGQFDLVYAWGSLHHTGAMWDAIRNVTANVAPGGTLVLAIYKKHITSPIWQPIKWLYNQLPRAGQHVMALLFAGIIYVAKLLATRRNPLTKERGMSFWYDVIDWIGGYPYEYATAGEIRAFVEPLGFTLRRVVPDAVPTGNNEFVFERS